MIEEGRYYKDIVKLAQARSDEEANALLAQGWELLKIVEGVRREANTQTGAVSETTFIIYIFGLPRAQQPQAPAEEDVKAKVAELAKQIKWNEKNKEFAWAWGSGSDKYPISDAAKELVKILEQHKDGITVDGYTYVLARSNDKVFIQKRAAKENEQ